MKFFKNKKLTAYVMAALMAGSAMLGTSFGASSAEAAVKVNPIAGISDDFIKGADVSMLPELERLGGKFYANGMEKDCLAILQEKGINWVRVRIWNDPYSYGPNGNGGGVTDEKKALEVTKRAKALGMKVLVDFHYSDWWADPGKQYPPKAWENHNAKQLAKDVYNYTAKVMKDFNEAGVTPDMVQIGNELNNGMLWPVCKTDTPEGYKALADAIAQGLKAVKDNDPNHQVKRMVHLANGNNNALYRSFFDELITNNGVNDFDIIGFSYYPFWHGSMEELSYNMNDMVDRYGKDVVVVETAYAFTNEQGDAQKNCAGPTEEAIAGYKSTVQGQASGLHDVMEHVSNVKDSRGKGIFYWEPDWIPVEGAGWKAGEGNEWENLAMFDFQGNALESLDVFKMVSDQSLPTQQYKVKTIETELVTGSVGQPVEMPKKASVVFENDVVKTMPVTWADAAPVFDAPGKYTVKGTVQGVDGKTAIASIDVIKKVNLVKNGTFENGDLNGWTITGDKDAVNTVSSAGDARGKSAMHYWADKGFKFQATQSFEGLKDGKYTVSCWTQGGGGEHYYTLMVRTSAGEQSAVIADTGWNNWQQWTIRDVEVKDGKATIGIDMVGNAGNWGSIDDVEFYLQE